MNNPRIGLSMLYCLGEPFEKMIQHIPETRTIYIEIVDDGFHSLNKRRVSALRDIGQSYNLEYSVHAPFAGVNIALPSRPLLSATMRRLKNSIAYASSLECYLWIFHPGMRTGISMFYPGMDWAKNLESVRVLSKLAHDHNVEAAIENVMDAFVLKTVEDFRRFYSEIGEDIGLVLDIGHAHIRGQLEDFVTQFHDRIVHVHAHDNDGMTDKHLGIGNGTVDWRSFSDTLKKASYDKVVVVESVEHIEESIRKLTQLLA